MPILPRQLINNVELYHVSADKSTENVGMQAGELHLYLPKGASCFYQNGYYHIPFTMDSFPIMSTGVYSGSSCPIF